SLSSVERLMTTGRVFLQYFKLILMPVDVVGVYEFYSIPTAGLSDRVAWAGLVFVAGLILCAVILARTARIVSFAVFFFFLTLLPVATWFVPIGPIVVAPFVSILLSLP